MERFIKNILDNYWHDFEIQYKFALVTLILSFIGLIHLLIFQKFDFIQISILTTSVILFIVTAILDERSRRK
jgi:hypothetical protein